MNQRLLFFCSNQESKGDSKKKRSGAENATELLKKCLENLKLSPGEFSFDFEGK